MRPALLLVAALLLTGCGAASSAPPPPRRFGTEAEIRTAVADLLAAEHSVRFVALGTAVNDDDNRRSGELRVENGVRSVRALQEVHNRLLPEPLTIGYLLIGDAQYVDTVPGSEITRPWRRIGKDTPKTLLGLTELVSAVADPTVALRNLADGATITGAAEETVCRRCGTTS